MNEDDFIAFLERELFKIADAMVVYYDCCNIRGSSCKVGDPNPCCIRTRFGEGLCPYLTDNQCQNPNASCRLWLCKTAIATTDPKCVEGLTLLEHFGNLYGIVNKPMIGQPYVGADRPKI